jgi:hypothetical protein
VKCLRKIGGIFFVKDSCSTHFINPFLYIAILVIYIYAIYAYVNKLNNTQCSCAVNDMKYIHNTLYYIFNTPKFIFMLVFMLVLLYLVILIVMLIGYALYYGGDAAISWVKKPTNL